MIAYLLGPNYVQARASQGPALRDEGYIAGKGTKRKTHLLVPNESINHPVSYLPALTNVDDVVTIRFA